MIDMGMMSLLENNHLTIMEKHPQLWDDKSEILERIHAKWQYLNALLSFKVNLDIKNLNFLEMKVC